MSLAALPLRLTGFANGAVNYESKHVHFCFDQAHTPGLSMMPTRLSTSTVF